MTVGRRREALREPSCCWGQGCAGGRREEGREAVAAPWEGCDLRAVAAMRPLSTG